MLQALSFSFHLTHDCNLRCGYCYTGTKTRAPMSEQTADAGLKLVEQLARNRASPTAKKRNVRAVR